MIIRRVNRLLKYLFVISIFSCSQRHGHDITIALVDSTKLNDTLNVYVYATVDALHESSERYIAICKNICDIKQEDKTVASTLTYGRIDSVVGKRIYIASQFNIKNLRPTEFNFWQNYLRAEDSIPNVLHKIIALDTCGITR